MSAISPMPAEQGQATPALRTLFDISHIDFSRTQVTREGIEKYIPHRGQMSLLDGIVWTNDTLTMGVGVKHIRSDEFWVAGHFPAKPMFPGVLMVETAAQLACYLFLARRTGPTIVAFLRMEDVAFRSAVVPGDEFYVLCQEIKIHKRRFESKVQGLVGGGRIAFEGMIIGMSLEGKAE